MAQHEPPLDSDPHSMGVMAAAMNKMRESGSKVPAPKLEKAVSSNLVTVVRPVATRTAQRRRQPEEPWVDVPPHPKGAYDAIAWPEKKRRPAVQHVVSYTNTLPPVEVVSRQSMEVSMKTWPGYIKYPFLIVIFLIGYMLFLSATSFLQDEYEKRGNARGLGTAQTEVLIAQANLEKQRLEKEAAIIKGAKSAPIVVAPATVNSVVNYDCNTAQSNENGFFGGVVHQLSDTGNAPVTLNGCASFLVDRRVESIVGNGYLIEFPDPAKAGYSFPTPSSRDPSPVTLWNEAIANPKYGKVVRVLVKPGSSVTITPKGE